jgi:transcription elongation factor Elf1
MRLMMQRTLPQRAGAEPHTLTCRVCGSANVTPTGRRSHLGPEIHHCDDCGAEFGDESETRTGNGSSQ